jgi:putative ABC transport system permease protein
MSLGSPLPLRAARALARGGTFTFVCVLALAIGVAAVLLIALHLRSELSFDSWVPEPQNVFRVALALELGNTQGAPSAGTAAPIAAWLLADFPEVRAAGRMKAQQRVLSRDAASWRETVYWTDPELLDVLPFPVLAGDARAALEDPRGAVLTRSAARRLFGADAPVGMRLQVEEAGDFEVLAVIEDPPSRSHLAFQVLLSSRARHSALQPRDAPLRLDVSFDELASALTYIRVASATDPARLGGRLQPVIERRVEIPRGPEGRPLVPVPRLSLQALSDLHFVPAGPHTMKPAAKRSTLYSLAAIGALILVSAGVNFVNLLTARAPRRAREVVLAKVAGATRAQLVTSFLLESLLLSVAAAVLGLSLAELALPRVAPALGLDATASWWTDPLLVAGAVAGTLAFGVLAGLYPALLLAGFRPATLGRLEHGAAGRGAALRSALVALQFAVLIGLGIAALVLREQAHYAADEGLAIDTSGVLAIQAGCEGKLRPAVEALPGVAGVACSDAEFGIGGGRSFVTTASPGSVPISMTSVAADYGLLELFGLRPVAGRFFSRAHGSDESSPPASRMAPARGGAAVINQSALRRLGFASAEAALGQPARLLPADPDPPTIVGIVGDFPLQGVRHRIQPTMFRIVPGVPRHLLVKLRASSRETTLAALEEAWRLHGDGQPLRSRFLDASIAAQYADVRREIAAITAFAVIAMLIAGLGLFGLSAFLADRRVREIGLRKALGAQTSDVLRLVLWQFSVPVLAANLLAWPVAAWALQRWLEGFVYRIDLAPFAFVAVSIGGLGLALVTVGAHSLRAAAIRPAQALRNE